MSILCPTTLLVSGWTAPHIRGLGAPLRPKTEPKYAQTNLIRLCPRSNSIVRDHPSLRYFSECLYHVQLPCWCPGGPYLTFGAIGPSSGPKNEPKYTLTNQIGLCPCSNSIVRGHSSLESPWECLYHVCLPCRCLGGTYHKFGA